MDKRDGRTLAADAPVDKDAPGQVHLDPRGGVDHPPQVEVPGPARRHQGRVRLAEGRAVHLFVVVQHIFIFIFPFRKS